MTDAPPSPYKGLRPFDDSDLDARLFFGRDRDREVIAANLLAARLTVLYGPSGVGKSSVLRAGVARQLRELPESPIVVVFSGWAEAPERELAAALAAAAGVDANGSLVEVLQKASGREVFLILDQAEELFLYDEAAFVTAFPEVVSRPDLRVNVLLSIRDDALARLDVFKARLPDVLGNYLRLDRLSRDAGREAIVKPVESWSTLGDGGDRIDVEPGLVEAVLDEVGAGRIDAGLGGRGAAEDLAGGGIETPYLQLVMQRVWDEERAAGSRVLRLETFRRLGGARRIVADHLERAIEALSVRERDVAAGVFHHLVTPSGTKVAHGVGDLAGYAGVSADELDPVLRRLEAGRILRTAARDDHGQPRYEIFHDVLAGAVLGWRGRHDADRRLDRERGEARRRHRRLAVLAAVALVGLAVATALSVYAFAQRSEARDQTRVAKARELEASAVAALAEHPGRALQLALRSVTLARGPRSEDVLRDALLASRLRRVFGTEDPVAVAFAGAEVAALQRDGLLHLTSATGRSRPVSLAGTRGSTRVAAAAFDAAGTTVAIAESEPSILRITNVAGRGPPRVYRLPAPVADVGVGGVVAAAACRDGTVVVARERDERRFRVPAEPTSVAVSDDGALLAVSNGKRVRVFELETQRLLTVVDDRESVLDIAFAAAELLVTASADSAARVWRLPEGSLENVMIGHRNTATAVAVSPDARRTVSASADLTARVWEVETAKPLGILAGHTAPIDAVAFDVTGGRVVTGARDGTVRVWEARFDPELAVVRRFDEAVLDAAFDAAGRVVATTVDGVAHVLDARSGRELARRRGSPPLPQARYGNRTAEASGDDVVLRGPGGERVLRGHRDAVTGVAFSSDGRLLVSSSRDHHARLWDGVSGRPIRTLRGHFAVVSGASFSPDSRWVVTAGPGTAGLFDVATGKLVFYLRGHEGKLSSARFDPTGRRIVTAGEDGTVRTYACEICGGLEDLVALARRRLDATR